MGGLLTLGSWVRQFPEINTVDNPGDNHIATIQGISVASYNVGCFVGAVEILGMTRRVSPSKELVSHTAELCLNQLVTAGTTASSPGRPFE